MKILIGILIAISALFGCAAPKSFDEALLYGYRQNGALQQSAATALTAGNITKADAQRIQTMANQATQALDAALLVGCGKTPEQVKAAKPDEPLNCRKEIPKDGLEQLSLATKVLEALQIFVNNMLVKK